MSSLNASDAAPREAILIVEDDLELASMITDYLRQQGFAAESEPRGDRAVARIVAEQPSLVVLDVNLPGMDGLTVCREVRGRYAGPILMLTARCDEHDEVVGLEVGADDYLAKPVRPRVLLARVRALLRRPKSTPARETESVCVGNLTIDPAARVAFVNGTALSLTTGEFDLLFLLASHAGKILDRQLIYQRLMSVDQGEFDRAIDLRVSRLRQKLQQASGQREVIKTIRGIGYLYVGR
jgi:DNA-binding response OmpR family regulator